MKTAILTIALALASALSALAQTVMRENSTVYFQTNVFLHDDPTNPLHQRISVEGKEPLWVAASNQVAYYQSSEMTNASIHARYLYSTNATLINANINAGYLTMTGNLNMGKQGITNATYISSIGGDIPSNLVVKAGSAGLYGPDHVNGGNLLLSAGTPRGTGTMGRVVAQGVFDATNLTASTNLVVTTTRSADIRIGPEYGIGKSAGIPGKNLYLFASDAGPAATAGSVVITAGSGGKYGTNGVIELVGGVSMTGDLNMGGNRMIFNSTSWLQSDGTNLFFVSTVPPGFTNALTTNTP